MNLRALLRSQGVSARDLDDAVASARQATRWAGLGAEMVAMALLQASQRMQSERARELAQKGAEWAIKVKEGTSVLLTSRAPTDATSAPMADPPAKMRRPKATQVEIVSKRG